MLPTEARLIFISFYYITISIIIHCYVFFFLVGKNIYKLCMYISSNTSYKITVAYYLNTINVDVAINSVHPCCMSVIY